MPFTPYPLVIITHFERDGKSRVCHPCVSYLYHSNLTLALPHLKKYCLELAVMAV
jgi:hypothetical protein